MVKWGDMGLASLLFLDQNSWFWRASEAAMGFMVAMAWAGTRLEEGNLNMVRDIATLYILVNITCLKILTPYRQFPF